MQSPAQIKGGANGSICGGELGHGAIMWKKFHSASNAVGTGFGGMDRVAEIMLGCATNIPAINTVHRPGLAAVGRFMDQYLGTWGGARGVLL